MASAELGQKDVFAKNVLIFSIVIGIIAFCLISAVLTAQMDVKASRRYFKALWSDEEIAFLRKLELLKGHFFVQ
jgi:hypothetical protein